MGLGRTILLSLAAASVAAPCLADEDDWPVLKGARVDDQPPALALAIYRDRGETFGLGVYPKSGADGPYLLARQVRVTGGVTRIAWTTSTACPQLAQAMSALARVPAPRIGAPRLETPRGRRDDSSYLFWSTEARWARTGPAAGIELRATAGPLAGWADRTAKALEPCWAPSRPAVR